MTMISRSPSSKALLAITDVCKSFGDLRLFDDLTLSLHHGDRVFLVGENGIGKSTLLKLIAGELQADLGAVHVRGTVGYLPQNPLEAATGSVQTYLVTMAGDRSLQEHLAMQGSARSSAWQAEFNRLGGFRFGKLLAHLGLKNLPLHTPFARLSGGQKTKVALAGLAVMEPALLLLDEPTNHLDSHALTWLERFLASYRGAFIVVSHDRALINNSANRIVELAPETRRLNSFRGGYRDYLGEKERIYQRQRQLRESQEDELQQLEGKLRTQRAQTAHTPGRIDNDKLGYNFRGAGKQRSQKRMTKQLHANMDHLTATLVKVPMQRRVMEFNWRVEPADQITLQADGVGMAFGGTVLFRDLSFAVGAGERLMLWGPNGCGKTTLLKILAERLKPTWGACSASPTVKIGYLDQEQESLDLALTPVEACLQVPGLKLGAQAISQYLSALGLFDQTDLCSPAAVLSTGKQRKLQLAMVILSGANVLLLDEPTNHIDLMSVEAIEAELVGFPGLIVAASHDRWFCDKVGTRTLHLNHAPQ